MKTCNSCGAEINENAVICVHCGASQETLPAVDMVNDENVCSNCGNVCHKDAVICVNCGQALVRKQNTDTSKKQSKGVDSTVNQFNTVVDKTNEAKKKKSIKIIIAAVAVVLAIAVAVIVAPKIFVSVDDLCAQGNYEKAYEKSDSDEKMAIRAENVAAVLSAFSAENLKDPDSFKLREAYYDEYTNDDGETTKKLVLYISGANSYGASVSSYWLYNWDSEDQEWSYFCSVSDFDEEEYNSYDDEDERLQKYVNNLGRALIKSTMLVGLELSKDAINRINTMFEADTLDEVVLIKE